MKNTYNIEGVKCGGCVATVKDKLSKLETLIVLKLVSKKKL